MDAVESESLPKLPVVVQVVHRCGEGVLPEAVTQWAALKHGCLHGAWHVLQLCFLLKWRGQVGWKRHC